MPENKLNRERNGFSIVEVVIVMLVLGILAAVVVPGFARSKQSQSVRLSAIRMAADLQYAQSLAKTQSKSVLFAIFDSNNSPANNYEIKGVQDPQRISRSFRVSFPDGVEIVSTSSLITFDHLGQPDDSYSIVFNNGTDNQTTVVVEQATGAIRVQYD